MPRDLTDLMESATRSAPPEPHAAADITRLAVHRQRRRTTGMAAGLAVAVVAAGSLGYGLTRSHDSAPQPAEHFKPGQTVDVSRAVPASSLPGYTLEPWTIPSGQLFTDGSAIPTYQAVDSTGRLLVVDAPGGTQLQAPFRARLYDAPGGAAQPLQAPASPGNTGSVPITWLPAFYGDDQLLWHQATGGSGPPDAFHLTDLQGGHDQVVPATFRAGTRTLVANPNDVTDGSMWMTLPDRSPSKTGVGVSDVYRATFSGQVAKVGSDVTALDVGAGTAGWVTSHGQVFVQSAAGTPPEHVRVPLDRGCRLSTASSLQSVGAFAVSSSAVAIGERCGSGKQTTDGVLVFDLSGRALGRVTGVLAFNLAFAGDSLLFQGNELTFRYDLVTGSLSQLGAPGPGGFSAAPQGAGSYVLWYDGRGPVAKIDG